MTARASAAERCHRAIAGAEPANRKITRRCGACGDSLANSQGHVCRGLGPSEGVGGAPRGPPFPAVPVAHPPSVLQPQPLCSPQPCRRPPQPGPHRRSSPASADLPFGTWPAGMGARLRPSGPVFLCRRPGASAGGLRAPPPRTCPGPRALAPRPSLGWPPAACPLGPLVVGGSGSKLCCPGTLQPGPSPPPSNSRGHHPLLRVRSAPPWRGPPQTA